VGEVDRERELKRLTHSCDQAAGREGEETVSSSFGSVSRTSALGPERRKGERELT